MSQPGAAPKTPAPILVIRGGAIGDFLLTLPVFAALRAQFPRSRLEVIGYAHITPLAVAGGLVDDARSIDARPLAGFFARHGTLDPALCEYFARFGLIVSYLYDPDFIFQTNVRLVSAAQFLAGPHRPDEQLAVHATDVFLRPLERLAIFGADAQPRLRLEPSHTPGSLSRAAADNIVTLALHPGSGSESKNWPEANWERFIDWLVAETPVRFLLVGGEAEGGRLERLVARIPEARRELAFHRPLVELGARLSQCAGFVGHDSGITHLAAALNLPLLILWGNSNEAIWRPRCQHQIILRAVAGLRSLSVDTVCQAARDFLTLCHQSREL